MKNQNVEKKNLTELSFKELCGELFETLTDLEKKFFKTFKDLTSSPHKVIESYLNEGKHTYFSPIRYLFVSLFFSFLVYSIYLQPETINGPFYQNMRQGIERGIQNSTQKNYFYEINEAQFNQYYIEAQRLFMNVVKLITALIVPSVLLSLLIFFRKSKLKMVSMTVISLYVAAHGSLLGSLIYTAYWLFQQKALKDYTPSFLSVAIGLIYFTFSFYKIFQDKLSKPIVRSFFAALLSFLFFLTTNALIGGAVMGYTLFSHPEGAQRILIKKRAHLGDH